MRADTGNTLLFSDFVMGIVLGAVDYNYCIASAELLAEGLSWLSIALCG